MTNPIECPLCKTMYNKEPEACSECGYPFSKSDKERSIFVGQQVMKKSSIKHSANHIKRAQIILFAIAGINLIAIAFSEWDIYQKHIEILIIGGFFSLGMLVKKNPVSIMTAGLVSHLALHALIVIFEPSYIFKGIVIKVIIIASLISGIVNVKKAEKYRKESEFLHK